jgi:hypothetical protein
MRRLCEGPGPGRVGYSLYGTFKEGLRCIKT